MPYKDIEKRREVTRKWREKNPNAFKEWSAKNPNYYHDVRTKNRARLRKNDAARSAAQKLRKPRWFSELDELVWAEAMDLCVRRESATGMKWEADHIIPLQGRLASGLHVWNNCQVLPRSLNRAKGNKYTP